LLYLPYYSYEQAFTLLMHHQLNLTNEGLYYKSDMPYIHSFFFPLVYSLFILWQGDREHWTHMNEPWWFQITVQHKTWRSFLIKSCMCVCCSDPQIALIVKDYHSTPVY